jgi:hypothetical protein
MLSGPVHITLDTGVTPNVPNWFPKRYHTAGWLGKM